MFRFFNRLPKDLGVKGETIAVRYLKKNGYKILDRNFRIRSGEIDIVARDGDQLVFLEVKARRSNNQEFLMASVNRDKEKRLIETAAYYIEKKGYYNLTSRFDVVFVVDDNGKTRIEHIKDAF